MAVTYERLSLSVRNRPWDACDRLSISSSGDRRPSYNAQVYSLVTALAISSELGMRPLMERVLSRREILKAWYNQPASPSTLARKSILMEEISCRSEATTGWH